MPIRDQQKIRRAAVAGRFYEGEALDLRRRMAETEAQLPPVSGRKDATVRGCILPHAGYLFSLGVAMETMREARQGKYRNVVLLGPSHYIGFHGVAGSTFTSWRTPFGDLSTALSLQDKLEQSGNPLFQIADAAHAQEHSLEVEFPLIQYFLGAPEILPLVVGGIAPADLEPLAEMFAAIDSPETLWVVSSDFTHYGSSFRYTPFGPTADPAELNRLDREAAERIAARDLDGFRRFLGRTGATICGAYPIALYLALLGSGIFGMIQAIPTTLVPFGVWRFIGGLAFAGIFPAINAVLSQSSAPEDRGRIFGLSYAAQQVGSVIGPIAGGAMAMYLPLKFVIFTSGFVLIPLVIFLYLMRPKVEPNTKGDPANLG